MKKLTFTVLCILCLYNTAFTQKITVGLRLGSNVSKLTGDYGVGRKHTDYSSIDVSHTTYGIFLDYGLIKNLSAQLEVNSRTKRMYYTSQEGLIGADWAGKSNFNYLEIPFLAKYKKGKRFKAFANLGPVVNILLSGGNYDYYTWGSHAGGVHNDYNRNIKSDFNTTTIGILGGLGFEWNVFNNFVFLLEARITYDLSNAAKKNSYKDTNTGGQWYYNKTRFFTTSTDIGIAYRFSKKVNKPVK